MTAALVAAFSATVGAPAPADAGDDAWWQRAARAESALRADEAKLRFRHHIVHVIKLWQTAVRHAEGPERVEALKREARVWALLAHWSGRSDDAARASAERREARAAEAEARAPADPSVDALASTLASTLEELGSEAEDLERFAPRPACLPVDDDALALRTVVIDPGHGGDDEGASNRDGVLEKDVNLAVAVGVAERLDDLCVVLTRRSDDFVSLADRVRIANEMRADLFVSIHANGSPRTDLHGVETYVLATDGRRYSGRLRDREAELHGLAPPPEADPHWSRDLRLLIADLAMRGATREARRLAARVQSHLVRGLRRHAPDTRDLGVKSALFYVLLGARMPSILVEMGFMTHPREGRRLARPAHQTRVARAIVAGVREFARGRAGPRRGPVVATVD